MKICIFGSASELIDEVYKEAVEKLSEKLAIDGHTLVFGAGAHGLMGASARGFKKGGGKIIGVIPHFFREERIEEIYMECDQLVYTDTMSERKAKMEDLADAFIIVPGGCGTFEEFFEVFTLKQLDRHKKPIAVYDIKNYYDKLMEFLDVSFNENFLKGNCRNIFLYSKDEREVIDYIENDKAGNYTVHDLKQG